MGDLPSEARASVPAYTMILEQSAHMDWDWRQTFCDYYWRAYDGSGVDGILTNAVAFAQSGNPYTVCEMGFFREFLANHPDQVDVVKQLPDFSVISGGITSPDCLVCSGEAFIRNYLVGQTWLKATLGRTAQPHCWIPDDFGQDPGLPSLLQALGFVSVAFSRLSGSQSSANNPPDRWSERLYETGLDFVWTAADGASLIAHWLTNNGYPPGTSGYGIGVNLKYGTSAIDDFCSKAYVPSGSPPSYASAPTGAMFIPIDDDFMQPIASAAQTISEWNASSGAAANVTARLGSFDEFIRMVMQAPGTLAEIAYNGTPYWTGYYASRPALKILHCQALRLLVGAEVMGTLARLSAGPLPPTFWSDLEAAWTYFVPSTHHDYVCGTALDDVYLHEQLPRLTDTVAEAAALQAAAMGALPAGGGNTLVCNTLGFPRTGLVEIAGAGAPPGGSFALGGSRSPVQQSAENGLLLTAPVGSLGYVSGSVSNQPPDFGPVPAQVSLSNNVFEMANGIVSAVVDAATGTLLSLTDNQGNEVLAPPVPGDDLRFYQDSGGLYRFGNETLGGQLSQGQAAFSPAVSSVILENGPLRARVRLSFEITVAGRPYNFIRETALVAGEPFVRMTVTGTAPSGYSVMAALKLVQPPATIDHGTPAHWTDVQPSADFWNPPVFRATHNFLLPRGAAPSPGSRGPILAAIYHGGIPAWAIDTDGSLIGCLLRNTPNDDHLGAAGSDNGQHTQSYAVRVPAGLGELETGAPLQEALAFNTPPVAVFATPAQQALPITIESIASVPPTSPAILTVAKPGSYDPNSLILRIYQPTNQVCRPTITLGGGLTAGSAYLLSAAEGSPSNTGSAASASGGTVNLTMTRALATVALPSCLPPGPGAKADAEPLRDTPSCSAPAQASGRPQS